MIWIYESWPHESPESAAYLTVVSPGTYPTCLAFYSNGDNSGHFVVLWNFNEIMYLQCSIHFLNIYLFMFLRQVLPMWSLMSLYCYVDQVGLRLTEIHQGCLVVAQHLFLVKHDLQEVLECLWSSNFSFSWLNSPKIQLGRFSQWKKIIVSNLFPWQFLFISSTLEMLIWLIVLVKNEHQTLSKWLWREVADLLADHGLMQLTKIGVSVTHLRGCSNVGAEKTLMPVVWLKMIMFSQTQFLCLSCCPEW